MSLFRKPKRIQRRVFCVDDDDDGEPEPPPPPVISHGTKENKTVKTTPLLSFADEGMDVMEQSLKIHYVNYTYSTHILQLYI